MGKDESGDIQFGSEPAQPGQEANFLQFRDMLQERKPIVVPGFATFNGREKKEKKKKERKRGKKRRKGRKERKDIMGKESQ